MKRLFIFLFALVFVSPTLARGVDITMKDLQGSDHSLSDYRGKWVVVNYWATWCPPCLEEIPELVHFHETHKDKDAVVLGVNMEYVEHARLRQFSDENFITYPVFPDGPSLPAIGPVTGLPTTYLIAPDGTIAARQVGAVTSDSIEAFISKQAAAETKAGP